MGKIIRLGSRKSPLALVQAYMARDYILGKTSEYEVEIVTFMTKGDAMLHKSLQSFGRKGVFTEELEQALLEEKIDFGVHSMKDLPYDMPSGFTLAGILPRDDCRDVLVVRESISEKLEPATDGTVMLKMLPANPVIGTSSTRRAAQLKSMRGDVQVREIRGNEQTRKEKLDAGEYDALVLAAAGLERLKMERRRYAFDVQDFIPAPGQGIIALQSTADNDKLALFHDKDVLADLDCLRAERAFAGEFGGGCTLPVGASARILHGQITLYGFACNAWGKSAKDSISGKQINAGELGQMLAARIRKKLEE